MYEHFTDEARKIMQLANQEAQRFNQEYIGTEHILLGCLKLGGAVCSMLRVFGHEPRSVRQAVEAIIQTGPETVTMGKLPHTPRAKKVIELAIEEGNTNSPRYVDEYEILIGLIREDRGVAAQVLRSFGVTLEHARQAHGIEPSQTFPGIPPDLILLTQELGLPLNQESFTQALKMARAYCAFFAPLRNMMKKQ